MGWFDRPKYYLGYTKWMDGNPFQKSVSYLAATILQPPLYHGRKSYNIALIGAPGAGKTSLINSFLTIGQTVYERDVVNAGDCREIASTDHVTQKVCQYKVGDRIILHDWPGFVTGDIGELAATYMDDILEGKTDAYDKSDGKKPTSPTPIKMDAVIIVMDALPWYAGTEIIAFYRDIIQLATKKDIRVSIALTKVDLRCADTRRKLTNVGYSQGIGSSAKRIQELTGVGTKFILPVQNYKNECDRCDQMDKLLFHCLKVTLDLAIHRNKYRAVLP